MGKSNHWDLVHSIFGGIDQRNRDLIIGDVKDRRVESWEKIIIQ